MFIFGHCQTSYQCIFSTVNSDSSTSSIDPRLLKPILNENEGFYQIGPPGSCKDIFVISVTVAFAANLPHVSIYCNSLHLIIKRHFQM